MTFGPTNLAILRAHRAASRLLLAGVALVLAGASALTGCGLLEPCGCREESAVRPVVHGARPFVPEELPGGESAFAAAGARASRSAAEGDDRAAGGREPRARIAADCLPTPPEGMACVPGGWFVRGVDVDEHRCDQASQPDRGGNVGTTPAATVWLDTFYVDLTEVTNEAYRACVRRGDCAADGPRYTDFGADRQPVTGVSWYSAVRFCEAHGRHLITEAEWEAAARGPGGDAFPWGDEPAGCDRAVIMDASGRACGVRKRGANPDNGRVHEVAGRPAGRYGLFDMAGNAEEWVHDWWAPWDACGEACLGDNPRGPCGGAEPCPGHSRRGVRGGSWYWPAEHATGYHRRAYRPSNEPPHHFGFRCAASAAEAERLIAGAGQERRGADSAGGDDRREVER